MENRIKCAKLHWEKHTDAAYDPLFLPPLHPPPYPTPPPQSPLSDTTHISTVSKTITALWFVPQTNHADSHFFRQVHKIHITSDTAIWSLVTIVWRSSNNLCTKRKILFQTMSTHTCTTTCVTHHGDDANHLHMQPRFWKHFKEDATWPWPCMTSEGDNNTSCISQAHNTASAKLPSCLPQLVVYKGWWSLYFPSKDRVTAEGVWLQ